MILIDSSVGSKDLIHYSPLNDPSLCCLANLSISDDTKSSADICFTGNGPNGKISIGIEYKKLSDLLSSIDTGRLQATQLQAMQENYDVLWLLTHGEYRCGDDDSLEIPAIFSFLSSEKKSKDRTIWNWYVKGIPFQGPFNDKEDAISDYTNKSRKWKSYEFIGSKPMKFGYFESALISLSRVGILHKHFTRIEDCAKWIGVLYRSWNKPWDGHKFFRTFDKSSDLKSPALMPGMDEAIKAKIGFAKEFPGMGFERALAAAQYFGDSIDMMTATVDEWMKVPGIGKVIAKSNYEWARKRSGQSQSRLQIVDNNKVVQTDLFD